MDVAVRSKSERDRERAADLPRDGFGFIADTGVEISDPTKEAIWRDGWSQMVGSGTAVCETVAEFEDTAPQELSEDALLNLNEHARRLARSTQTLLAIAREGKGR